MPFRGTDKKAFYSDSVKKAKTPAAKSKAYNAEKAKNEKQNNKPKPAQSSWSSFSYPKSTTIRSTLKPRIVTNHKPSSLNSKPKPPHIEKLNPSALKQNIVSYSFSEKSPLFANSTKKINFANAIITKLENYVVDKLAATAEEIVKIGVRKVISNYLPIDLVEKIEKTYKFVDKIKTYIKIGKKVYEIIVNITKQGRNVYVETNYTPIDYNNHNEYNKFYKNNFDKIKQLPDQVNDELEEFEEWSFCGDEEICNELFALVLASKKTATCSLAEHSTLLNEINKVSILTNFDKSQKIKIKTTKQYFCKFKDVTVEHARKEGEGDLSLEYWRTVHKEFFTEELNKMDKSFNEEIVLLCEEFIIIE